VSEPAIQASGVHKAFDGTPALAGAGVTVEPGQLVALLGPSGSGKTTLLRVIAGLEVADAGSVAINGRPVAGPGVWVEPEQRHVGMVFQDGALFPHLSVADNVGFGHPAEGRIDVCLELVGLADRRTAYPHELSGGERQRVALARALAPEPEVVLLDEPFTALDATLRTSLRADVARILRDAGASALLVTHDQQEALSLADVVVMMRAGVVEQVGSPEELYARPATRWAAEFLGAAQVVSGVVEGAVVRSDLGELPVPDGVAAGAVELVVRPEQVVIDPVGPVTASVVSSEYFGHDHLVVLELAGGRRVQSRGPGRAAWGAGDQVRIRVEGRVGALPSPPS